ncbi:unnamed protein product [Prunus armeniaca]|uniref:Uncharacterized protein n=1 Tax=Prunus armeniaca TaxID=36596 RepID=A0A6J5U1A4_PRUAR|nr:unnamed protein product [Prunus armeniaca]
MEDVQTSFDKILTLIAKEADPLVIEEEDDGVAQDILEKDCNYAPEQQKRATDHPYGRFLTPRGYGHA